MNRLEELEIILARSDDTKILLHPKMAQRYRQEVRRLREAFNHPEHRTEAATLLRSLVDKVVLTPNGSKKPLTIYLHGDLAGILH